MPRITDLDPEMSLIVNFCHEHGLAWEVNSSATEISFRPYYYRPGEGVIATFKREDDADYVLKWLEAYHML